MLAPEKREYPKHIIPAKDLRFVAACAVCGVPLQDGYGISNQYSRDRKYDRGEPGDVFYFLRHKSAISPSSIAKVWLDPKDDVAEAMMIPERLRLTREIDAWRNLADDIDALHVWVAVANMKAFAMGEFSVGMLSVTDEEESAAQWLSDLPARMRSMTSVGGEGKAIAADIVPQWERAMVAWVKAWAAQYIEIKKAWLAAKPRLRIDRGDENFPIIIPKGKDFEKLLRRWGN
jgi:hypothetical protein